MNESKHYSSPLLSPLTEDPTSLPLTIALSGPLSVENAVIQEGLTSQVPGAIATHRALNTKSSSSICKYFPILLIFLLSTLSQVYVGIKCLLFHFTSSLQPIFLCISVLWINLLIYLIRTLIEEKTCDRSLRLPSLHAHPLFFDKTLSCHYCDLCSSRVQKAWRCKLCDFDLCVKCASRKDAAQVGENVLRSDKGVRQTKELSNRDYLKRTFFLALPEWKWLFIAFFFLIATSIAQLILPNSQGQIVQSVVDGPAHRSEFLEHVTTYIIVMVSLGLFNGIKGLAFSMVGRKIAFHARNKLFSSIIKQDIAYFDGTTSGRLTSRLTNDVAMMMGPIQSTLSSLLYNVIMLIGGVVMCFRESYQLATLAFTSVGPILYLWDLYGQWSKRLNRLVMAALAEANSVAQQALSNIRTVKSFAAEENELGEYKKATKEALEHGISDSINFSFISAVTNYIDLGAGMLILSVGGLLCLHHQEHPEQKFGVVKVKNLIAFQLYWNLMNTAYQSLQNIATSFTRASAAAERVFSLIDALPDIHTSSLNPMPLPSNFGIEFKNVSFFYQMRPDSIVLNNLTLTIPQGKVIALVGRSGGGKTTIINLIQRFYDPKRGSILLGGCDLRELSVEELRAEIGVVDQETSLFAKTIAENITYGSEPNSFTKWDIVEAAKSAMAHEFIMNFRDGYNTRVGERGMRISGGQRQRIALARIFLRRPKLLLLDEATSALDAESEAKVQNAIDRLISEGKEKSTVVLVAHRLSTVINADKIAVVDKGKIVEQGTHDELIQRGGVYSMLVEKQIAKKRSEIDENDATVSDNIDKLLDDLEKDKM